MTESQEYWFSPRPEAHAMKWDDLLPPVKSAVSDLLVRIMGAEADRVKKNDTDSSKEVSSCFLVYGSRGTGKTTVLLSAKDAAQPQSAFFGKPSNGTKDAPTDGTKRALRLNEKLKKQEEELKVKVEKKCLDYSKDLVWLDVLDLEPLPPNTNLLTALLTRIRNALDPSGPGNHKAASTSIFEEEADGARQQFSRLINDATLMWEDIQELDTRNRANRQIAAADIYANFRSRFNKAMNDLSTKLGQPHGHRNDGCSIVLPIDNIDRSTEHLHAIVKLAQMVSHPCLWLIMAGDRVEVETFLERAYWKELIHNRNGVDAKGKQGLEHEDEALVMARRQAAAATQKIWPPSHRVEVKLVQPEYTLGFSPPGTNKQKTIYELLYEITIPTTAIEDYGTQRTDKLSAIRLIDLFDAQDKVRIEKNAQGKAKTEKDAQDKDPKEGIKDGVTEPINVPQRLDSMALTRAARHGLLLPARGVLDLWQLAYWVANDPPIYPNLANAQTLSNNSNHDNPQTTENTTDQAKDEKIPEQFNFSAEKLARTMLRNSITGSQMQSTMGQCLQNKIICRIDSGGTLLDFSLAKIKIKYMRSVCFKLNPVRISAKNDTQVNWISRSSLSVKSIEDIILGLEYQRSDSHKTNSNADETSAIKYPQPFVIKTDEQTLTDLPPTVSAWLIILHDILLLAGAERGSAVVNRSVIPRPPIVEVCHEVVTQSDGQKKAITIGWPLPEWSTFLAHDVFRQRWKKFRTVVKNDLLATEDDEKLRRLLAAGWVACVIETYGVLTSEKPKKYWLPDYGLGPGVKPEKIAQLMENIDNFEKAVLISAALLYSLINDRKRDRITTKDFSVDLEPRTAVREWIEDKLPLLFSHLYVPTQEEGTRFKTLITKISNEFLSVDPPSPTVRSEAILPVISAGETPARSMGSESLTKIEVIQPDTDDEIKRKSFTWYKMQSFWKENWPFILADFDKELKPMFKAKPDSDKPDDWKPVEYFNDLHQTWEKNRPSEGKFQKRPSKGKVR